MTSGNSPAALRRLPAGLSVVAIRLYRMSLGALFPGVCRFEPSCSRYTEEAIRRYGALRGTLLGGRRLLRCRPFGGSGYDPVPESSGGQPAGC